MDWVETQWNDQQLIQYPFSTVKKKDKINWKARWALQGRESSGKTTGSLAFFGLNLAGILLGRKKVAR